MLSVFEKLRFILATKLRLGFFRENKPRRINTDSRSKRIVKKALLIVVAVFVLLFIFGLYLSYTTPPTIYVTDSKDNTINTGASPYMIKGRLGTSLASELKINNKSVELIDNEFAHSVKLKKGGNRFVIEASNDRGIIKEIYIIEYYPGTQFQSREKTPS